MTVPADLWRDLTLAVGLLTRLPVTLTTLPDDTERVRAMRAFPLVGLIVGAIGGTVFWIAAHLHLPAMIAALLAVLATILVTGALHEDGLADCADGFGGGRDVTHKLNIMRDHAVGTYGALALMLSVGLRSAALSTIAVDSALPALIAAHSLSRGFMPPVACLKPARDDGLGAPYASPPRPILLQAVAIGLVIAALALGLKAALIGSLAAGGATVLTTRLAKRQIGGFTGDVFGAAEQLSETAVLIAVSALW
jgi:adenosylcobinamide-GDP ribazoletransferase